MLKIDIRKISTAVGEGKGRGGGVGGWGVGDWVLIYFSVVSQNETYFQEF